MALHTSFLFGLEIELLLRPKDNDAVRLLKVAVDWKPGGDAMYNRNKLRKLIQRVLKDGNIESTTDRSGFDLWVLDEDMSLNPDESEGYCEFIYFCFREKQYADRQNAVGVQLISPVLSARDKWQSKIAIVYGLVDANFDILGTNKCSTHVHIAPQFSDRSTWVVGELQSILKAACLFDRSITDMMPDDRKECSYAYSNFDYGAPSKIQTLYTGVVKARKEREQGKDVDGSQYEPAFAMVDSLKTAGDVARLYPSRFYSLNFNHFGENTKPQGTIEFRRPPVSENAQTCVHWTIWIMAFLSAAISTDWRLDGGIVREDTVAALREFLLRGVKALPETSQHGLSLVRLYKQEGGLRPMTASERQEVDKIKLLKADGKLHC